MGWYDLKLRWPSHYAGFIEDISVIRPNCSEVRILFCKGKKEISSSKGREYLNDQAKKIYEKIKSELQKC